MPAGRPSKYGTINMEQVEMLASKGFTDAEMAGFFNLALSTWHLWKKEHPEFSDSLKEWKENADRKVERSLYERATGFRCIDTKFATHEGNISDSLEYIKEYPPDTTAAIFWLKNRKKAEWRDRHEVGLDGTLTLKRIRKTYDGTVDDAGD